MVHTHITNMIHLKLAKTQHI